MKLFERLENRVLFDAVVVTQPLTLLPWHVTSKGTLVVNGIRTGDLTDNIHLQAKAGKVTINWNKLDGFRATGVKRIYVDLGGGNDKIQVDTDAGTPVTLLGGGGNDRLSVTGGPATLVGGAGHDVLIGRGDFGMEFIGGRGNDRMYGTAAPDIFTGGSGVDYAETILSGEDLVGDAIEQQFALA